MKGGALSFSSPQATLIYVSTKNCDLSIFTKVTILSADQKERGLWE